MIHLFAVLLYLVGLAAIAFWRSRRVHAADDFLIAGRSLPAGVLMLTLLSTWIGAGSVFGSAGLAYRTGLAALWQSAGAWAALAIVYFIAPRVRRMARYTVPDILELRYGPAAGLPAAITIVVGYSTIVAYQFRGAGRLLGLVTDMNPVTGAFITAIFCIAFASLGGMQSVAYLDVANGLIMIAGFGVAVVYLIGHLGGLEHALVSVRPDHLTLFGSLSPASALTLLLPTMFLLFGEANMYQKLFSARGERAARVAIAGWIAGTIALEVLIVSAGLLGSAVRPGLGGVQSETIVARVAVDVLPTIFGALLTIAATAAIISTASSFLLTAATASMHDVYQRFRAQAASDREVVLYTRILVIVLGSMAFVIGHLFPTMLAIGLWPYTMYAAGVTPALAAVFLWSSTTRAGGVASIAAGMLVTLLWEMISLARGGYPLGIQTLYPALLTSIGTLIGVSLAGRQHPAADPH